MKIKLLALLVILITATLYSVDGIVEYFTAKSDGSSITIEWKSITEDNAVRYELERASTKQSFQKVKTEYAKGAPSYYKYIDEEAFLKSGTNDNTPQSENLYSYRLKIYYKDNSSSYSNPINVIHNVNSIKRTWGMIKEMFR
jgi:hypothetical protein